MMNPPFEGEIITLDGQSWPIKYNGYGEIVLRRSAADVHPEFVNGGMSMLAFCCWINGQYNP